MKILAIETSCDETALAILDATGDIESPKFTVLASALNSQIEIHKEYGGVFPAMAKRAHAENIVPLLETCLSEFISESSSNKQDPESNPGRQNDVLEKINWDEIKTILDREPELFAKLETFIKKNPKPDVDLLAVTSGPGLEPALWVGINFARALSVAWSIPLLPINHMEGHIASVLLEQNVAVFPVLALLISGGHTELIHIPEWKSYTKIGQTVDDAIGEAYDKVARLLDLSYPGGPEISKLANNAREAKITIPDEIALPRPMLHSKDFNFSFSGIKTAALYLVQRLKEPTGELSAAQKEAIALEFETAVTEVLCKKLTKAIIEYGTNSIIVGGGVIANTYIRSELQKVAAQEDVAIYFPNKELSTDNAVMIAMAAYLQQFDTDVVVNPTIKAEGNLSLD